MADFVETWGFVFSAEDLSTPALESAVAAAESASDELEGFLGSVADNAEALTSEMGSALGDFSALLNEAMGPDVIDLLNQMGVAFDDAVGEEAQDAFQALVLIVDDLGVALEDAVGEGAQDAGQALMFVADDLGEVLEDLGSTTAVVTANALDFSDAFRGIADSIEDVTFGDFLKGLAGAGAGLAAGIGGSMKRGLGKVFGKIGLMGMLLGPIKPILALFKPLIGLLSDTLMPIFNDFMGIIQNSFAPLMFVLDTLLQSMIPAIQKAMAPLVAMLTLMAIQLGGQLQQAFTGLVGVVGPLMTAVLGAMPALQSIFKSVVDFAIRTMPVFLKLLTDLLPIAVELFNLLAKTFVDRLDILADLLVDIGPELIETFAELLIVMLPLVKVFLELGTLFLRVMAPAVSMLVVGLKAIVDLFAWILDSAMVLDLLEGIGTFLGVMGDELGKLFAESGDIWEAWKTDAVDAITGIWSAITGFFTGIGKGLLWLYDQFIHFWSGSGIKEDVIEPAMKFIPEQLTALGNWVKTQAGAFLDWIGGWWEKLVAVFDLDAAVTSAKEAIQLAVESLKAPMTAAKEFINTQVDDTLRSSLGTTLGALGGVGPTALGTLLKISPFAEGGIATGEKGVLGEIGEAGTAEAVVPLDRRNLKTFMEPALGEMGISAGLDEQTGLLGELVSLSKRALRLLELEASQREQDEGTARRVSGDHSVESDLTGGVGMGGLVTVGG